MISSSFGDEYDEDVNRDMGTEEGDTHRERRSGRRRTTSRSGTYLKEDWGAASSAAGTQKGGSGAPDVLPAKWVS